MSFIVKETGGGDFKLPPAGTTVGVCFMVVDLGMQDSPQFGPAHKVLLGFELPEERIEVDGVDKPMIQYTTLTASLSEKANLRKLLESWRGRTFTPTELEGFDLFSVLGVPCMLSLIHTQKGDKTYSNISSVSGLPRSMPAPKATRLIKYSVDDRSQWDELPEWVQKKIGPERQPESFPEHDERNPPPPTDDDMPSDDIPF